MAGEGAAVGGGGDERTMNARGMGVKFRLGSDQRHRRRRPRAFGWKEYRAGKFDERRMQP
jgi:hypothetical protein